MKTTKIFGKAIPTFAIAIVLLGSLGVAVLLNSYGTITGTANVEQSVLVDGGTAPITYSFDAIAGNTYTDGEHTLKNQADVSAGVVVTTTRTGESADEMDTKYTGIIYLSQKDENWNPITDMEDRIEVEYTIVGEEFDAVVTNNAIDGYTLIYYADHEDRFNNPAKAILIDDVVGNLPYDTDKNRDGVGLYDYCESDGYKMCNGAKIWYVPTGAINSDGSLDWSQMADFYYETELIQYNADGNLILYPDMELEFNIVNTFDVASVPGEYNVTTNIIPQAV